MSDESAHPPATPPSSRPSSRRRIFSKSVPAEGEDGLFTQSWFPICMSSELPASSVYGTSFLDGRVVAVRGADGAAQVLSAYCPHLGADLAAGQMIGNNLRCAFHRWQFAPTGQCAQTGSGEPAPRGACLFSFPTVERYGLIWAFNGDEPIFPLPDLPLPDDELALHVQIYPALINVDPWVVCCNTPDIQHLQTVHGVKLEHVPSVKDVTWTPYSMSYEMSGVDPTGWQLSARVGIIGTSIFYYFGQINGRWFAYFAGLAMPSPGKTRVYKVIALRRADGDEATNQQLFTLLAGLQDRIIGDDMPVLQSLHFRPGSLTKSDSILAAFLDYLRRFPRAHPSAEFIR